MTSIASGLDVWVKSIGREADRINAYGLRRVGGGPLPTFRAGALVVVERAPGLARSGSLVNPEVETHRCVIAAARDRACTGGSRYMHESVQAGSVEGGPDHGDVVLSADERRANSEMMICCYGSRSDRSIIDI